MWKILQEHIELDIVEVFETVEEAEATLGAPLVPAQLGLVATR